MTAFGDQVVTFLGRLETLTLCRARRAVTLAGGVVRRDLAECTDVCIVGHRAASDLDHWRGHFDRARQYGARLVSENQFLRLIRATLPASLGEYALDAKDVQAGSGLTADHLDLLALFDVVEPVDGAYEFRDLILARSIAHLLAQGVAIADVVRDLAGRRKCFDRVPASLVADEEGRIVVGVGATRLELGGQLRLPLLGGACPSAEALFEMAEAAEDGGDYDEAERLYRSCLNRDRGDWMAAFNLANVLQHLEKVSEARQWLEHAVACRPGFADGWYNLGVVAAQSGGQVDAAEYFTRALGCDPLFADALYNLAALHFGQGRLAEAADLWRRYLQQDGQGEWARRARHGVALCHQLASQASTTPAAQQDVAAELGEG